MGVLCSIVFPQPARPVDVPQFEEIERSAVGRQPVRCDALGLDRLVVQQALEQLRCGLCVPPALDYDVQDLALTARHRYIRFPPMLQTTSSRCQRGDGAHRRFFNRLAISGPNLIVQHRIVS